MELPIYETLEEFKEYYEDALNEYEGSKLNLLRDYEKKYKQIGNDFTEKHKKYSDEISDIFDQLPSAVKICENEFSNSAINDLFSIGNIDQKDFLIKTIRNFDENLLTSRTLILLERLYQLKELLASNDAEFYSYDVQMLGILTFIEGEKQREKDKLLKKNSEEPILEPESFDPKKYTKKINQLADEVFSADKEKLSLLEYLADNFSSSANNFTELTKYNQIYFYLNRQNKYSTIPQAPYKKLIKEMFGFDYGKSEIKGETPKHQTQLRNKALYFKA